MKSTYKKDTGITKAYKCSMNSVWHCIIAESGDTISNEERNLQKMAEEKQPIKKIKWYSRKEALIKTWWISTVLYTG